MFLSLKKLSKRSGFSDRSQTIEVNRPNCYINPVQNLDAFWDYSHYTSFQIGKRKLRKSVIYKLFCGTVVVIFLNFC